MFSPTDTMLNAVFSQISRPLRLRRYRLGLIGSALVLGLVFALITGHPAQAAYRVQFVPNNPELGDTLAVMVSGGNTAPTVTVGAETYATYDLGSGRYRALIPTSPVTSPGRMTVRIDGDQGTQNTAISLSNRSFQTQYITLSPGRAGLEGTDYEFSRMAETKALRSPQKYWNGPMTRPSGGRVSSVYGLRRYYNGVFAENYYHRGVDYAASNGSPLYAPAAGRIALTGRVEDGFVLNGNTVGIDHGQGVVSIMIHLSRIDVNEGDYVEAGQVIGRMGSTGFASGPNLHWGLYVNDVAVDPAPWRYDGIE